ncbi:MAG TPA: hypothetical protein DCP71_09640, partial [Verrucomicrobiales bacterium]|nr:hypothetical protein [Verrucomicrobiales bacterium]
MDYQLRLVYRRDGSGKPTAWSVVVHRDRTRQTWAWRGEQRVAGRWAAVAALPEELMLAGVKLEDAAGKVMNETPAVEAVVASHRHPNYNFFRRWNPTPGDIPEGWVLGIDPKLPSTVRMKGEEDKVWVQVWVRVPSFLMAIGETPAERDGQNDYLWLHYNLKGGRLAGDTEVRYGLACGDAAGLWGQTTENSNVAKPSHFMSRMAGFCERALGVRRSEEPLRCFWEAAPGDAARLVMRRQFLTTAYAAPFVSHEKEAGRPLTLEQRSSKSVLRLATEWPPTVPAGMGVKPGGRDAMMQAWTVRPQILNDVVAPGGVLKRVENTHWREIFSAGWTRLMATWEPNL